jgi:hypothetical protein
MEFSRANGKPVHSSAQRKTTTLYLISQDRIALYEKTIADLENKVSALQKTKGKPRAAHAPKTRRTVRTAIATTARGTVDEGRARVRDGLTPADRRKLSQMMKARWAARRKARASAALS